MVNNDLLDEMVAPDQEEEHHQANETDADDKSLLDGQGSSASSAGHASPITTIAIAGAAAVPLTPTSTANDDDGGGSIIKLEDDPNRLSPTSLYCSLPLSRDVQSIIDTFPKTEAEKKKTRKLPCLYCDRTFVADSLRQKHVERCHSVKQARRSSSRFQQVVTQTLQCMFCSVFQLADNDLNELFRHLVGEHSDRYFACVCCQERFALKTHLDEHKDEEHGIKRELFDSETAVTPTITNGGGPIVENVSKSNKGKANKDLKLVDDDEDDDDDDEEESVKTSSEEKSSAPPASFEQKELRSKRIAIKSTKLGIKRSARLQNKELPNLHNKSSQKNRKQAKPKPVQDAEQTTTTTTTIATAAATTIIDREAVRVSPQENPYPTFDAFYRVKKITDHSIDNLRITSLTFNDVFDQAFYTRIKCNIAENLMNHIDGKLFKNEESESRISNFEKTQGEVSHTENNYGCEISLNAATPVASFLTPQLGDDPESQIEYGSKASKKKTKPDEVVLYKYFTRRKYQASIQEIKENRDLSKLDMWTQYIVKNRQQAIANTAKSEKEKIEYKKGVEYRAKVQNEELNRILDRRGPFDDLKEEANKQAVLDGNASRESRVVVSSLLENLMHNVFELSLKEHEHGIKTELTDAEIPDYLHLRKASLNGESHIDRSDKITLICSSEETENFEAPQVSPRDKHALAELTGEWTRSRLYICAACGLKLANMRALIDHKNIVHQNVWCQHYEFVGKQGAYYKNLSIPGLGKMEYIEANPLNKTWTRSNARMCSKCKKQCNTLGELHRHILECGEDWSWMLIRKKCKYRPFGAKTRRKRRGLFKRQITNNKEKPNDNEDNKEKKTYKRDGPRVKPSDAETIQRMLANLPAKRATRKVMSLKDGFPKSNRKKTEQKDNVKKNTFAPKKKTRAEQLLQESSKLLKRKVLVASQKCNPVGNVRKSVRNINKVISSALIDNNILVRRKVKAMQAKRVANNKARAEAIVEPPAELTEEERAEEVKKKISLLKKVQNLRRSVIKKRTTKDTTTSNGDANGASASGTLESKTTPRKTRSAANVTDNSSGSSDKDVKSPAKKKLCKNFGTKLMRTLTMRRRNKDKQLAAAADKEKEGESVPVEGTKRKLKFSNIKKAVKKLKASNKKLDSDIKSAAVSVATECAPEIEPEAKTTTEAVRCESAPTIVSTINDHFLEESIQESATRTISDSTTTTTTTSDNNNRPSAVAPLSDNIVTEIVHQNSNSDNNTNDLTALLAPINTTILSKDNEEVVADLLSPITINVNVITDDQEQVTNQPDQSLDVEIAKTETQVNALLSPTLVDHVQKAKPKGKLCKRTKGLNDCIAMLTSKLKCKNEAEPPLTVIPSSFTDAMQQVPQQQQHENLTPHDTTTEEQNVVIPEETVSENLESAKEPESAPPSPIIETQKEAPIEQVETATAITISDLTRPVIEQDKENIELEQKSLLPQTKQGYDISLEKVVDIIKCFEDINSKEIRNGHLDSIKVLNQAEVINGLTKCKKPGKKIGAAKKTPKKRTDTRLIQEQLNIARIEEDNEKYMNGFDRKIGTRRSLPQRKTKKIVNLYESPIQEYNWETYDMKDVTAKGTECLPSDAIGAETKKELSTIVEESKIIDETQAEIISVVEEKPTEEMLKGEEELTKDLTDESQVTTDNHPIEVPLMPLLVHEHTTLTEPAEIQPLQEDVDTPETIKTNLQPENEEDVLENKVIPQIESPSDSEDELPLAKLAKNIPAATSVAETETEEDPSGLADTPNQLDSVSKDLEQPHDTIKEPHAEIIKELDTQFDPVPEVEVAKLILDQTPDTPLGAQVGPVKRKRGRKRKSEAQLLQTYFNPMVEPLPGTEASPKEIPIEVEHSVPTMATPVPPKSKRGRKKKSDLSSIVLVVTPSSPIETSPETTINTTITSTTDISASPKEADKLPLSVYDFDEDDDERTGDNSKENMDQLKAKSPKRIKRNSVKQIDAQDTAKQIMHEEPNTPLKDVQNESFIQTPDLNDSSLVTKISGRFKFRKGKAKAKKQIVTTPVDEIAADSYCEICHKQFVRLDSLNKHKRTLTHIAKLSEIEALEAEAKKKLKEMEPSHIVEEMVPEVNSEPSSIVEQDTESLAIPEFAERILETEPAAADLEIDKPADDLIDIASDYETENLRPVTPVIIPLSSPTQITTPKSILVTSPFSIKTNNDCLKLAHIISDVLNKPVEDMENYTSTDMLDKPQMEPKRYKSLGERKSFDSDSVVYNPTPSFTSISPASTLINKSTSDEFLKNQLSLLENIIEENKASFEYMDEASVQSVDSNKSDDRCPSDMSLVSDIKADDSSRIISYSHNLLDDDETFVKPNHQAQYEEISEDDSMNNRNYDEQRARKTLNRDEELFLECCSLLKSSSEVSNYSKKSSRAPPEVANHILKESWIQKKDYDTKFENDDAFLSDSCPNTPIGDAYDDFSNSNTIKTVWNNQLNEKAYEDISQSSADNDDADDDDDEVVEGENTFKVFNFKALDSKSDIEESSNSVDFRKNIDAKFGGLMAEALKSKSPKRKKAKERESRRKPRTDAIQTAITDYAVQLTPKSSSDSTDNYTDLTSDSKKMLTKGAMKVFEGLKVSIPTDELDMNQVLNCSPTSKRLELEESAKVINGKCKNVNFGNKLGLKVTKKRNQRNKKLAHGDEFMMERDKVHDVYDFEETQDNTDLFSPLANKLTFRNGSKTCESELSTSKSSGKELDLEEVESESESNNLDAFNVEVQSVNSFSTETETESSTSIKPTNASAGKENITKKKCVIMGRIFKNAFKAKTDDLKENTPVDEVDPLESYIIGGPLEEIATPPPEKSPIPKERPKMTEKEMDLLFDKLLQDQPKSTGKSDSSPQVSPTIKAHENENKEQKDVKIKKHTPKSVKANRRRSRKHSQSSDDEFNLSKTPKKRQPRKNNKDKDNGINLEQELKECMGVAGRKSQRKCTSGKQNVLIEDWSSDDSEYEAMLRLSMQETKTTSSSIHLNKDKDTHIEEIASGKDTQGYVKETKLANDEEEVDLRAGSYDEYDDEPEDADDDIPVMPTVPAKVKTKRSNSNAKPPRMHKPPKTPKARKHLTEHDDTLASNRRKRAAVDTLYYWSSSSEDDTVNLIEVKSLRDEIDDEEDRPQHGWIVGDSPKKLVTLLAHAKGKKTCNR